MTKTQNAEAEQSALPMTIQDLASSSQLIESLRELRLRHWSDVMVKDLAEMAPSEQGLILKSLNLWSQTEKGRTTGPGYCDENPVLEVQTRANDRCV